MAVEFVVQDLEKLVLDRLMIILEYRRLNVEYPGVQHAQACNIDQKLLDTVGATECQPKFKVCCTPILVARVSTLR